MLVDDTKHNRQKRNTEDIITVGEETGASDENGTNVIPAEWCFVDFG